MLKEQLFADLQGYINEEHFKSAMQLHGNSKIRYLAQGEYNLNYLLETDRGQFVLRVNTASQMNLDNQIVYEYQALELLQSSGVTPRPFYLDDSKEQIPYGLLVMEFLPGRPLDYRTDLLAAAAVFARIHSLMPGDREKGFLIKAKCPFSAIYQEAEGLLQKYFDCDRADLQIKKMFEKVLLKAETKREDEKFLQREPWQNVINTEVNSHNFIVNNDADTCHLIDWEKPILGEPAQDIAMFLLKTTTMWKRNYELSETQEQMFVARYLERIPEHPYKSTLLTRVEMFKFFNYLRALAWCAMAWTEYSRNDRELVNLDTFERIKLYLQPEYLKKIFPSILA